MGRSSEEPFTYIDRILADHAQFMRWIEAEQQAHDAAKVASERMLSHPLLGIFSKAVGVEPTAWGQATGDLKTEVSLFHEWLEAAEEKLVEDVKKGGQLAGVGNQGGPDTLETQVPAVH